MSVRSGPLSRIFIEGAGMAGAATGEGPLTAVHDVSSIDASAPRAAKLLARGLGARTTSGMGTGSEPSVEGSVIPQYGIRGGGAPCGGVCLPKDTRGYVGDAGRTGADMPLLRSVVGVEEEGGHLKVIDREVEAVAVQTESGVDVA